MWYEESVADLVRFFESAGFSRVSYSITPRRISIKFHNCDRSDLGANLHTFEAGIVSGSSLRGRGSRCRWMRYHAAATAQNSATLQLDCHRHSKEFAKPHFLRGLLKG